MERNISIVVDFESCIIATVSKERISNANKDARAERKALEEEKSKITVLGNAIQEGIDSGRAKNFDPQKQLEALKSGEKNDPILIGHNRPKSQS